MIELLPLTLRLASAADDAFWFELYASTRADELQAWGWDESQQAAFLKLQFTAQQHSYQAHYPQRERSLICLEGVVIGGMQVDRTPTHIHLIDLAILPPYRNRGIGTQLLQQLCDSAQRLQQAVHLQVSAGSPAMALYTRLGFQPVADTGMYWQMIWQSEFLARVSP
jgi:ribosomal protein S18 acetylase RimI-like enzyme